MKRFISSNCARIFAISFVFLGSSSTFAGGNKTFSVVSYNAENVFDQEDNSNNDYYGDYRIKPNKKGYYSNYGEKFECSFATSCSFTDIKVMNIRKVLMAIDPQGPDIVGLQEIESNTSAKMIFDAIKDLGYTNFVFSESLDSKSTSSVGTALYTKFKINKASLLKVKSTEINEAGEEQQAHQRPILKVNVQVSANDDLTVYVNHWRAKSAPESLRYVSGKVLHADIARLESRNSGAAYIALGDFNSAYNEKDLLKKNPQHNDTNGLSGINDAMNAVAKPQDLAAIPNTPTYNLVLEVPKTLRNTHYDKKFGWTSFDHMIIGNGMFDQNGIDYELGSFAVANPKISSLKFLFNSDGTTKRWNSQRTSNKYTKHAEGGYSDHTPLMARFTVTTSSR